MKKLLPPQLFVLFALLMAGLVPLIAGIALAVYAKRLFRRRGTNIMTFQEPDLLITDGPFQYSRNPMYLGMTLALAGVAVLSGLAPSSLALLTLFIVITDRWYIAHEERAMSTTFGEPYRRYCQNVRRWL